jgi:predicted RNA polymerase sigma factor
LVLSARTVHGHGRGRDGALAVASTRCWRAGRLVRLVRLDDQDRSPWNEEQIAEGRALLERATAPGELGTDELDHVLSRVRV